MAFSKLKSFLKKTAARTKDGLWDAIGQGIDTFTPAECQNYFAAAGYDRDLAENALVFLPSRQDAPGVAHWPPTPPGRRLWPRRLSS